MPTPSFSIGNDERHRKDLAHDHWPGVECLTPNRRVLNMGDSVDEPPPTPTDHESASDRIQRELGDVAQWLGDTSQELAKDTVTESGSGQDAAFFEFFYGLLYLVFGAFGSAMQKRGYPPELMNNLLQVIDGALFRPVLASRFGLDQNDPALDHWFAEHHQAGEDRGDLYATMPMNPEGGQGYGGTVFWEMAKRAAAAGGGEQGMSVISGSMKLSLADLNQIQPIANALLTLIETGDLREAAKAASRPPDPRLAVIAEFGQRLIAQTRKLVSAFKIESGEPAAYWETAYLLLYLTLRPAREQMGLKESGMTTSSLEMIEYNVLRELVCAQAGFDPEYHSQSEELRAKVNEITTQHTIGYFDRQKFYDNLPWPGDKPQGTVAWEFLLHLQTHTGRSFDQNELVVLTFLCGLTTQGLDPGSFVNSVVALAG